MRAKHTGRSLNSLPVRVLVAPEGAWSALGMNDNNPSLLIEVTREYYVKGKESRVVRYGYMARRVSEHVTDEQLIAWAQRRDEELRRKRAVA